MNCTDSTSEIGVCDCLEASFFNKACKLSLLWEFSDALNEVLVGILVIGNKLSHKRNHVERVEVVKLLKSWYLHL